MPRVNWAQACAHPDSLTTTTTTTTTTTEAPTTTTTTQAPSTTTTQVKGGQGFFRVRKFNFV